MGGPLEGIRCLEWGMWINGPGAASMLGDLGADVIKIEDPVRGDAMRGLKSMYGASTSLAGGINTSFELYNRSKKSITLDLKQDKGKEVLYKLVKESDVFCTNFGKPLAARLRVDNETLSQHNPKLVYASSSNLGSKGPDSRKRGFDPIVQARSGIMWLMGDRDFKEPVQIVGGVFDQLGATMLAWGILAALVARERTGKGQEIETSQLAAGLNLLNSSVTQQLWAHRSVGKHSRLRVRNPLSNHYKCGDGKWLMLSDPQSDRFWHDFCAAVGIEDMEKDPRFETALKRQENNMELIARLDQIFATRPLAEWLRILEEKGGGISHSGINDMSDVVTDPQVLSNEYIEDFNHPVLGSIKVLGCPVKFARTPAGPRSRAPEHGEHTEEVLIEVGGYSWEEIAQMKDQGVI